MSEAEANLLVREAQRRMRTRVLRVALPAAAALGAGAAIAGAAIPSGDGTITGCYLTSTANAPGLRIGSLRVIDPSLPATLPSGGPNPEAACLSDEATIKWSQSGPAGPQGPPGAAGPAGAAGQAVALPAVQFGFDNGAGKMFLKLDGVAGPTTDPLHKDDFPISSFAFAASAAGTAARASGAGRTSFSSFTITKHVDKSSAALQLGAVSDKHYKEADVFFARKAGNGQQDYLELKLDDVVISSYQVATGAGGQPTDKFTLEGIKGEATFLGGGGRSTVLLKPEASL